MLTCIYNILKMQMLRIKSRNDNNVIPYGRGAMALHFQILAETGMDVPVDELQAAIVFWKEEKYPTAWQYLLRCQNSAVDPGYIENTWGRRRYFPKVEDEAIIAANRLCARAKLDSTAARQRVRATTPARLAR